MVFLIIFVFAKHWIKEWIGKDLTELERKAFIDSWNSVIPKFGANPTGVVICYGTGGEQDIKGKDFIDLNTFLYICIINT